MRNLARRLALALGLTAALGAAAGSGGIAPFAPLKAYARAHRGKKAASPASKANREPSALPTLAPIDELQDAVIYRQRLLGRTKNPKARKALQAKKAYDALQAKTYPQARKLAAGLLDDPTYGDYGSWITAAAWVGEARKAFDANRNTEARTLAQKAISASLQIASKSPYSPHLKALPRDIGQAEVLIGSANAHLAKWSLAKQHFENGFQRLTGTNELGLVRPENLALYAEACRQSPTTMCTAWLQRFSQVLPRNSAEMRAVLKVLPNALDRPRTYFSAAKATASYKAPDRDFEAFDEAMARVLDQKYGDSAKAFEKFIDEYPKSVFRFRARYWLAESLAREKKNDEARKLRESLQQDSPLTYYGLLAGLTNGKSLDDLVGSGTVPRATATDPGMSPQELFRLKRAEDFISENALDLAAIELKEIKPRDGLSSPFLMYVAMLNFEAMNYQPAFVLVNELIGRNYEGLKSPYVLKLIFPVRFMTTIEKYAEEYKVDPILLLSLIKQESAFDPNAVSSVGALGLMQLMPSTAADMAPDTSRADMLTEEANIRAGAKYLGRVLKKFNGNIVLALAGYNAGPAAVARWYNNGGNKRSMFEFIETIPYRETREYVAAIIRNYFWYSKNLSEEAVPALTYFWGGEKYPPGTVVTKKPTPTPTPTPTTRTTTTPTSPSDEEVGPQPAPTPHSSATPAPSPTPTAPSPSATSSPSPSPTPSPSPVATPPPTPPATPPGDTGSPIGPTAPGEPTLPTAPLGGDSSGPGADTGPPTAPLVPSMSQ